MNKADFFELHRLAFNLALINCRAKYYRAMLWPGVLAMVISVLCNRLVWLAEAPQWACFLASFVSAFAAMLWLAPRAWRRYEHRKWNR